MKNKVKFDRKVNIRTRDSDRRILWYAIAVTLAAHLVFFGLFDYRKPAKRGGDSGSAVVMLALDDLPEEDREWYALVMLNRLMDENYQHKAGDQRRKRVSVIHLQHQHRNQEAAIRPEAHGERVPEQREFHGGAYRQG